MHRTELLISKWFPLHLALATMILPVKVLIAVFLSIFIHELGHLIMIKWFNLPVYSIKLNLNGARISTSPMTSQQELLCAAAGPLSNFIILLFAKYYPLLAACSLVHGVFNLLPIGKMDGKRILTAIIQILTRNKA